MKKYFVIVSMALLLLVTGCGNTKEEMMTCTRTGNMSGVEMDFTYNIYYQGDIVNKVQTTEIITSDDEETLKTYENGITSLYSNFDNIDHYNYDVVIEGNTLTSTTDINYKQMDMDKLLEIDSSIGSLLNSDNQVLLDKVVETYEATGATCK